MHQCITTGLLQLEVASLFQRKSIRHALHLVFSTLTERTYGTITSTRTLLRRSNLNMPTFVRGSTYRTNVAALYSSANDKKRHINHDLQHHNHDNTRRILEPTALRSCSNANDNARQCTIVLSLDAVTLVGWIG